VHDVSFGLEHRGDSERCLSCRRAREGIVARLPVVQAALRLVVGQGLSPGNLPRERGEPAESAAPVAEALGISVYAKQLVDGRDRRQLERLCR
jgi:hypothetical protein